MPNHVLITGASGNLGSEVVKKLYDSGYGICATVGSGDVPLDMAAMLLDARQVDLTDEAATQSYVEEITGQYPGLRAAVLLVGGFAMGSISDTTGAMLDKQINLNFKTAFFVARPLLKHFEKRGGGQIILVGSRPAILPKAGKDMVAYALSKSLLFRLAEFINEAGKGKQITASVLVPSTIDTAANRQNMPEADFTKWVKASDIAEAIAFLLSDTGSTLRETVLKVYNES
ncbi:MAG: SDR family NAD(P)-dependent oxidoreductase [Saprospiraceae bacterium]|nr:SDR family NAD(P)-dependent oxidoreductase [Saprospiraceae bacterium]